MKKYLITILLFACGISLKAQTIIRPFAKQLNVAVFVYPGVGLGDLQGPIDVFTKANGITRGQYHVYTVALSAGEIATQGGTLKLTPDFTAEQMPFPDILVIPGCSVGLADSMRHDERLLSFIKRNSERSTVIISICTAAYFVGQTGIFDGHKVTTHFFQADDLQAQFPSARVIHNVRYVDEGHLLTASGVTSGIDASLHLVQKFSGDHVEKMIEGAIQYVMHEQETWPRPISGMKFDRAYRERLHLLRPVPSTVKN